MLGTLHRLQPYQSGNFMEKWVEITEQGISYYKSAGHDRAQGFFPRSSVFEVKVAKQPENM